MIANPLNLADTILRKIASRTCRRVRGLVVEVTPEEVTIRGLTGCFHMKQLAQHSVRELLPTVRIVNAIAVEPHIT